MSKLSVSVAATEFCEWVKVRIQVYIPYHKDQVKPYSSLQFPAACAVAIAHRNNFFCLYQQNKSFSSEVKYRQSSNCCKRVLEADCQPVYTNETKESIISQRLEQHGFWEIANSIPSKGKSTISLNGPEVLSSASNLQKIFVETLVVMTNIFLYQLSILELI